jgi:hypothetical protein
LKKPVVVKLVVNFCALNIISVGKATDAFFEIGSIFFELNLSRGNCGNKVSDTELKKF